MLATTVYETENCAAVGGPVEDTLLNEIAEVLDDKEHTDDAVPEKLAKIANKRWHNKLSNDKIAS